MSKIEKNKPRIFMICLITCLSLLPIKNAAASDNIKQAGDIFAAIIPSVAYGATFYLDDKEGRNQFYKAFATNLGITFALKYSVNETRPNGDKYSFPSGHTSVAFQGAAFIHKRYGIKYAIPAYIGATFVGYSRVESNNHYTKDVVAGAAIGVLSSFYFTKQYKGFSITPVVSSGNYGFSVSKRW